MIALGADGFTASGAVSATADSGSGSSTCTTPAGSSLRRPLCWCRLSPVRPDPARTSRRTRRFTMVRALLRVLISPGEGTVSDRPTPGVDDSASRSRPIESVGTAIAAFVGVAPEGPVNTPTRLRAWTEYAQTFGGLLLVTSYLADAVHGYFVNGGAAAYVVRDRTRRRLRARSQQARGDRRRDDALRPRPHAR